MKRSLLRVNKIALVLLVLFPVALHAQEKPHSLPKDSVHAAAGIHRTAKRAIHKAKKKRVRSGTVEVINHSDDDKRLERIKAEKNKRKE
jgi:hypothetical protein